MALETVDDLMATIKEGKLKEHVHRGLELKEDWAQDHGAKISALANSVLDGPSWLVIGAADDGTLVKRQEGWVKKREEVVSQHINANLDPVQACTKIHAIDAPGGWVLAIEIKNPGAVVYWGGYAYLAAGTTIRRMEPEEVMELRVKLPGLADYSAQPIASSYDEKLVAAFADRLGARAAEPELADVGRLSPEELLKRLKIHGTQAARLLFGPTRFRLVVLDRAGEVALNENRRGLYSLLLPEFLKSLQRGAAKSARPDEEYPERAVRETVANAVAHAAYFEGDGDLIVEVRQGGSLSVSNFCLRESVHFANKWFSRSHYTANALLMEVLRLAGHVDELGRGKGLILAECLRAGKAPPEVFLESGGRYPRWKLRLPGGPANAKQRRVLERLREHYHDERKALIANALIYWRERPLTEIRKFVDDESLAAFAEVVADPSGPVFYSGETETITPQRWVKVLLDEGKDSKAFSPAEEKQVRLSAEQKCRSDHAGIITPSLLRTLAGMGNTHSEKVLSSLTLKKWAEESHIVRIGNGKYRFPREAEWAAKELEALVQKLRGDLSGIRTGTVSEGTSYHVVWAPWKKQV